MKIICMFLLIIFLIGLVIILSKIEICIKNLNLSTEKINGRLLDRNYNISIKLRFLGIFTYLKLNINQKLIENLKKSKKFDKQMNKIKYKIIKDKKNIDIKALKYIKIIRLKIRRMNLIVKIGTEEAENTAVIVGIIDTIIALILKNNMRSQK